MSVVAISRDRFKESFALPAHKSVLVEERADEARLRVLMDTHFDFVWRSLRRLGLLGADADDGTQEVFLVASRKLKAIALGHERNFLFATAVRVASTRRRSVQRRREEPLAPSHEQQPSEVGPERLVELSRARQDLQLILDGLELQQRAVFILFELEELTVPEIASALGVPVGTVSSRLRAAREHFQGVVRRLHARDAFQKGSP